MNKTTKTTLALGGMLSLALLTGCTLTAKKMATQAPAQQSAGLAPKVGRFRVETRLRSRVQHQRSLLVQGVG